VSDTRIYQPYFPKQAVSPISKEKPIQNHTSIAFQQLLNDKLQNKESIKFSAHAKERMIRRGIDIDTNLMSNLNDAMKKAESKGSKDSLVVFKDIAFVVNVPNRTVITAVDDQSMREHIFTNIDSAIII